METVSWTVGEVLNRAAAAHPEADAVVYPGRGLRWSYRELRERVDRLARALLALGVERGEHVALWAPNVPEWVLLQFATAKVGAVLVTVNTNYRSHEVGYVLGQSGADTVFLTEGFRGVDYVAVMRDLLAGRAPSADLSGLRRVVYIGEGAPEGFLRFGDLDRLAERVPPGALAVREAELRPDEPINMQYTSGTTGFPKGVLLSHRGIVNNALAQGRVLGFGPSDRLCIPVPLFHCFGCVMGTLLCACYGAAMVILEAFDPQGVLEAVHRERCTALHGVPTMFLAVLNHPEFGRYDVSSLRTGVMAGAPCPVELMKRVRRDLHMPEVCITYGQTEASPGITMTRRDDPVDRRVASVGRALPGVEVKIVDPDSGRAVPPGVQGELCSRGYNTMVGYYRMPEATAEAVDPDGWLHTGDLAVMDEQGYCRITGRLKNMIIRGGENIYPREIEEFLYTHPGILQVEVVGVPDERYGEQVLAAVVPRPGWDLTGDEVRAFCRGRIARHKVPRYVMFLPEMPLTASGKVKKYVLREMAVARYGLEEAARTETA